MTEPRHFHSARKGSGSLRPFPIYPLYTQAEILSLDKPIADCFLFRPRKSCERRSKCSHTNVSNTLVTRLQHLRHKRRSVRFEGLRRVHTCLRQQDRTQRLTWRNRGVSDGGAITTLGAFCAVRKPCAAGYQNGILCRFVHGRSVWERSREPSGHRRTHCASMSRGDAVPQERAAPLLVLVLHR